MCAVLSQNVEKADLFGEEQKQNHQGATARETLGEDWSLSGETELSARCVG